MDKKDTAIRLAELTGGEEGTRVLKVLQELFPEPVVPSRAARPSGDGIGIWKSVTQDGSVWFERREDLSAEWDYWAPLKKFAARPTRRRAVLLGESVAKGFHYDPVFTPAMAIEELLNHERDGEWEVLDLAKSNLQFDELRTLVEQVPALHADVVIVFAGNNWQLSLEAIQNQKLAEFFRQGASVAEILALCADLPAERAEDLVETMERVRARTKTSFLMVIPEFNLAQWRVPRDLRVAPWLRGRDNEKWLELRAKADAAHQLKKWARVRACAEKMLVLDGGSCPATFELLADSSRKKTDVRRYLERARDAGIISSQSHSPRCLSGVTEALRDGLSRRNIAYVDLAEVFVDPRSGLPRGDYFLDYCHLSSTGIAAAAASVVRKIVGASPPKPATLPSPESEGAALFLAAIHSAHRGQPTPFLQGLCDRARQASALTERLFDLFIDYKSRRAPDWSCWSFHELLNLSPQIRATFLNAETPIKLLDWDLIACMESGGRKRARGRPLDFGTRGEALELVQESHYLRSFSSLEHSQNQRYKLGYFQAFNCQSSFRFRSEGSSDLPLMLTLRLPCEVRAPRTVALYFNGRLVTKFRVGSEWKSFALKLPKRSVRAGVNELEIRWPRQEFDADAEIDELASQLELGTPTPFFPTLGEVFSLRVGTRNARS